jgi:hypothetical protein
MTEKTAGPEHPPVKTINHRSLSKHRKRFLKFFPKGFKDQTYTEWERNYKWGAHELWNENLNEKDFKVLLRKREYLEIAKKALQVESRTTFLFSFEKMALRDAVSTRDGASIFAEGIYELLHGKGPLKERFVQWIMAVAELPRKKSRVLSWPVLTLFPYLAQPSKYMIMKPNAMRFAAKELGYDLEYSSKPNWNCYSDLVRLADLVGEGIADLKPRDYHDLQTFLWVIGSPEYARIEEEL